MLTLVPGGMGGSESYARSLCRALASSSKVDAIAFVSAAATDAGSGLDTRIVPEYSGGTSAAGKAAGLAAGIMRHRKIRERFTGIDVVHYPFTVPIPSVPARSVVTLHDLQHRDLAHLFTRSTRAFRRVTYDRAARHADIVIVPSGFVRDRAEALLGLDRSRIKVVPHGVDESVFFPSELAREPFVLYPARVWPHKNHSRLVAAFALLRRSRPELTLVLTGTGTEAFSGVAGVSARGAVPQATLVELYRTASCVVFPSLYEGFGAPPLEAMACGTAVAASSAGSLPEVCGNAAVLFDPNDTEAIASGVSEALDRSRDLSELGVARAAQFSWTAAAKGHELAYQEAAVL